MTSINTDIYNSYSIQNPATAGTANIYMSAESALGSGSSAAKGVTDLQMNASGSTPAISISARNLANTAGASIYMQGSTSGGGNNYVEIASLTEVRRVIDDAGKSAFLQAATASATKFIWSQTSVTYPSTANNGQASVSITHGLGNTPVGVLALIRDGGSLATGFAIETCSARTSTTFTLVIRNNTGATQGPASMIIMWIAWV